MASHNFIDMSGQKIHKLTVIRPVGKDKGRNTLWECLCDCGNKTITSGSRIRRGMTKSCGCISHSLTAKANTKHGMAKRSGKRPRLYEVWCCMKDRCLNPNFKQYKDYGGRGITVCDEWMEFVPFMNWALANDYNDGLQIDRRDNDKGYSPENCRFVTRSQNQRNMRRNRYLTIKGETKLIAEWCEQTGLDRRTITTRIERGWDNDDLLLPTGAASYEYRKKMTKQGSGRA